MSASMKKTVLASSLALTFMSTNTQAALVADVLGPYNWFTDSANFTMLYHTPATVGGTNDVTMAWDGNAYNASSDYTGPGGVSNVTASSPTPFFGHNWVAHDIQVFTPGSYSFDIALGGGNPETGMLNATVGAGQLGMHMLFDYNGNNNIDIFMVMSQNSVFGSGIGRSSSISGCDQTLEASVIFNNCLWDGAKLGPDGKPTGNKVWMLASVDGNGDGIMGIIETYLLT